MNLTYIKWDLIPWTAVFALVTAAVYIKMHYMNLKCIWCKYLFQIFTYFVYNQHKDLNLYSNIFTSTWFSSALSFSSKCLNNISTTFVELIQSGQETKLRGPKTLWRENLLFHWRKISYFNLTFSFFHSFAFYFPVSYT